MAIPLRTVSVALLVLLPAVVDGYASFASRIPNGNNVPHPCKPNTLWGGVGHFNQGGGGHRNPFGQDFNDAGQKWTAELCRKDSDGDGKTNGEELGDPDCTWQPNTIPKFTSGISHPAVCEPTQDPVCQQRAYDVGLYRVQEEWMAAACQTDDFVCQGLSDPDIKNVTIRFPVTPVPANVTTYQCAIFEFPDLTDDVHMIATTPVIDNRQVMHHIVLFGCKGEVNDRETGVPYQCGMSAHWNCSTFISIWTLGQAGECYHPNTGVRMGLNGYKHVALQFHWNNPELVEGYEDSSGMTLYYTPNRRPNDAAVLLIGNMDFVIPPRRERVLIESTCTAKCTENILTRPIYITAAWNHMHYPALCVSQTIEHVRNGVSLRYITNDVTYSYDSPKMHSYDTPIEVLPGDELHTRCHFSSTTRATSTVFGESTDEEMCFGFLYYYPEAALTEGSCVTFGNLAFCDTETLRGCHPDVFFRHLREYLYEHIVGNCTNHGPCYEECKATILEARRREPCMTHVDYWEITKKELLKHDSVFLGSIASCETELLRDSLEIQGQCLISNASPPAPARVSGGRLASVVLMVVLLLKW